MHWTRRPWSIRRRARDPGGPPAAAPETPIASAQVQPRNPKNCGREAAPGAADGTEMLDQHVGCEHVETIIEPVFQR